jgi:hypothetical protein
MSPRCSHRMGQNTRSGPQASRSEISVARTISPFFLLRGHAIDKKDTELFYLDGGRLQKASGKRDQIWVASLLATNIYFKYSPYVWTKFLMEFYKTVVGCICSQLFLESQLRCFTRKKSWEHCIKCMNCAPAPARRLSGMNQQRASSRPASLGGTPHLV